MSEKTLNPNEVKSKRDNPANLRKNMDGGEQPGDKMTVVNLTRTAKVVKGGKRFSFRALVVVGDSNGKVGASIGKANQVQLAIQKASHHARKNLISFPVVQETIPHEVIGKFGTGMVWMKPAAPGTGVIAGGGVRAIFEAAGVKNILTKNLGSTNPFNTVYATLEGLKQLRSKEDVAKLRGKNQAPVNPEPAK